MDKKTKAIAQALGSSRVLKCGDVDPIGLAALANDPPKFEYLGSSPMYFGKKTTFIFTVTSVYRKDDCLRDHRCWGWYPTLKEARYAVSINCSDMHEISYQHVVIEKVQSGILAMGKVVEWYEWVVDKKDKSGFRGKWKLCKIPEWSKGTINWGMG